VGPLPPPPLHPQSNNYFPSYWEMSCLNSDANVTGCTGTITFRPTTAGTYMPADIISFSLQYLNPQNVGTLVGTLAGTVTGTNGAKNLNDMWVEMATLGDNFEMSFVCKRGKGWNPFNKYETAVYQV